MSKKKYRCFVTGGAGLIGLEICNKLIKKGHSVYLYDLGEQIERNKSLLNDKVKIFFGSILDLHSLKTAIKNCDYVFHHAAMLGVKHTEDNKLDCLEINSTGTKNVLEACTNSKVKKIIFASSSEVYGEPKKNPITEKFQTHGKTIYGISKLIGEEYCKSYYQKYNLKYTILRYFNTYGPYQIAQFVIPKFLKNITEGKSPKVYGDGSQIRSYCYVEDTALATIKCITNSRSNGRIINIGNSSEPISLKNLSNLCIKLFSKKKSMKAKFVNNFNKTDRVKEREIFQRYSDTSLAKKIINFNAKVKLTNGLKKLYTFGKFQDTWSVNDEKYFVD